MTKRSAEPPGPCHQEHVAIARSDSKARGSGFAPTPQRGFRLRRPTILGIEAAIIGGIIAWGLMLSLLGAVRWIVAMFKM